MSYFTAYCTDMGAAGKKNQDAVTVKTASFMGNEYAMAAVCDGVGGLNEGEKASSYIIEMLGEWFEKDLPDLLRKKASVSEIKSSLDSRLHHFSSCLNRYGADRKKLLATTLTAAVFMPDCGRILAVNVGDSRLYRISEKEAELITADHSVVGEKVRLGLISEESAGSDPRQNQITRCIGAGIENTEYDYYDLELQPDLCYMFCTDGFRKKITRKEIHRALAPDRSMTEEKLQNRIEYLTDLNLQRKENDNITAAAVMLRGM